MSTTYDWSPVFGQNGAISNYLQNMQYQKQLQAMMGQENVPGIQGQQQTAQLPQMPMQPQIGGYGGGSMSVGDKPAASQLPPQIFPGNQVTNRVPGYQPTMAPVNAGGGSLDISTPNIAPQTTYSGPVGQALGDQQSSALMPFLQALGPRGLPMLMQTTQNAIQRKQEDADKAVHTLSPQDAIARGYKPGTVVQQDAFGGDRVSQTSDVPSQEAQDYQAKLHKITPITDPHDPRLPPPNTRPPGAEYGTDAYGNVVETIKGDAKSPVAHAQDMADRTAAMAEQMRMMGMGGTPAPVDASSTSLIGQTGLSQAAIDWLTKGARPRGQAMYNAVQNEINAFSRKTGVDTSTLEAQAKGQNNVLTNNVQRNNQGTILENEIQGSVQTVAPLADAIHQGKISALNLANVWAGKQVNDPTVLQFKDQLVRLQHELAGYNAVAGGKLTENGTPRIEQSDLDSAANTITQGINSGGLQGLSASVGMSTTKNRAVLGKAIDDAQQGMWSLFGVGKNYKRQTGAGSGSGGGANVAPAGTRATGPNGKVLTSDGKGGWN